MYTLYWVGALLVRTGHPWLGGCWALFAVFNIGIMTLLILCALKDTARRVGSKAPAPQLDLPPSS